MPQRPRSGAVVVGLDLAGSPRRDTGACALAGPRRVTVRVVRSDDEILDFVRAARPVLVVIDAPLSLPHGRANLDDRSGPHLRACDRELLRLKVPFFPLTLGPMRMLTDRGMHLNRAISGLGVPVLEGYPGGSQDLLGWPRQKASRTVLQRRLRHEGLEGEIADRSLSGDELDAVTIAWVGWNFMKGRGTLIGDPAEGLMLLPEDRRAATRRRPMGAQTRPTPRETNRLPERRSVGKGGM